MTRTTTAVRIAAFGGPEVLDLQQVAVPTPGPGEFLLAVHAAGVNPVDWKIRRGRYPSVPADKLPYVLGREVSGLVVERGPGAEKFAIGDAVYSVPGIDRGGYAQQVLLRESEAAHKPHTLDHVAAAAVPLAGLTAWQGLFRHGGVASGQRVLIHGGSGGVGHFAIQFAKAKGAHVITTVSAANIDFVRRLGADEVIDYKAQRFDEVVREVDMVFDLIAGDTQTRSFGVLRRGGILVSTLTPPSDEMAKAHGVRAMRYTVTESGDELAEIAALIDAGKVKPVVSRTFPLQEVAAAQDWVERGHTVGKVVLTVA